MIRLSKEGDALGNTSQRASPFVSTHRKQGRRAQRGRLYGKEKQRHHFRCYPDVVNVEQMCSMLGGIGKKTAYDLLRNGDIRHIKLGKSFKIPKVCVIEYLIGDT